MNLSFLQFAAKLLPHLDKLDDLAESAEKIATEPNSLAKWENGVKPFGDVAVPIFHDVTGLAVVPFSNEAELVNHISAMKLGDGKLLDRLRKLYESDAVQVFLPILLDLFLKSAAG